MISRTSSALLRLLVVTALLAVVSLPSPAQQRLGSVSTQSTAKLKMNIAPSPQASWSLGRVRDVAVDDAGRVYVLDASDQRVLWFDARGSYLRSQGREGRGPGEFKRPRALEIVNDTLWVIDNANGRLTGVSTRTGKLVRTSRATVYDQYTEAVSSSGLFIARPSVRTASGPGATSTIDFYHETASGTKRQLIATLRGIRSPLVFRTFVGNGLQPQGEATLAQPLDNGWLYRFSPRGQSLFLLDRNPTSQQRTPSGSTRFRLLQIGARGDTISDRQFIVPSRRVSTAEIGLVADSLAHPKLMIGGVMPTGRVEEVRDSLFKPDMWPAVTEFIVGIDGSVWFRQPLPPSKTARFWRINAAGEEVEPVEIPSQVRVMRVALDRVWGVTENDDGMQSVQIWEILSSRSRRSTKSRGIL